MNGWSTWNMGSLSRAATIDDIPHGYSEWEDIPACIVDGVDPLQGDWREERSELRRKIRHLEAQVARSERRIATLQAQLEESVTAKAIEMQADRIVDLERELRIERQRNANAVSVAELDRERELRIERLRTKAEHAPLYGPPLPPPLRPCPACGALPGDPCTPVSVNRTSHSARLQP